MVTGSGTNNTAILDGFSIINGYGANGAGMYNVTGSPSVNSCIFSGNYFTSAGGGMYNTTGASPIVTNCIFRGNIGKITTSPSFSLGAGMSNQINSNPTITNCVFSGNNCFVGGAMYNNSLSSPVITNCTFSGNAASSTGGGLYNDNAPVTIRNCICYNNRDNSGTGTANSSIVQSNGPNNITYSLIQGQNPSGAGNLDGTNAANDPKFVTPVDPATAPTLSGDLHLQCGSPAINAGTNTGAPSTDVEGNARTLTAGDPSDMGAYEKQGACTQPTTTGVISSLNPSCAGSNVIFTATVLVNGNAASPAATGTVTFTEATTILADNIALNAYGQAAFSTNTLGAGPHTILATYNPASGLATSSGSVHQVVNATPTGSISGGGTYCSGTSTTTNLTLTVTGSGTISGTLSGGIPFSGTAPNITVTVAPASTTTYTIATLSDDNCTADPSDLTGSAVVTVNPRPTSSISGGATYCSGANTTTNLTINATGSGIISGTLSDGTPFSGTGPTTTIHVSVAPTKTTTYTIASLSDDNNCTALSTDLSGSATVTVNPGPIGSISGGGTYCSGTSTTTNLTLTVTGNGTISGTLSGGIPFSGTAPNITVTVAPASTTTYTIATLSDDNCTANPSDLTGSAVVTVNPRPTSSISGSATYCSGANTTTNLTINATGSGIISGTLSNGTPFSGTGPTTTIHVSVAPTTTTTYTIATLSDDNNCTALSTDLSGSATVTVNPRPTGSISGGGTYCSGTSTTTNLTLTVTGSGTISGTLSGGIPFSGTAPNIAVTVAPASTATYTIATLSDGNNCAAQSTDLSGSATVMVNQRPTASINGGGTYCSSTSTTTNLTLTVTGSGTISGTLSGGIPFSGTAPIITVPVAPASTTTYTIATLSDGNNCTAQPADLSGNATITVNPKPTGSISGGGTYCSGTSTNTNLTLTVTGSGTISGTLSGGIPFSGTAPNIAVTVAPASTTTYTIAALSDNNCMAQPADLSGSATVTVNPVANATVGGTTSVCVGAPSPNITFTGSGGTPPYTFTYRVNDAAQTQTVTTSTDPFVTVAVPTDGASTFTYHLESVQDASSSQCVQSISGQMATVTVNGLPTGTISGNVTVCQNNTSTKITFSGSGGTAPYTFHYTIYDGNTTTDHYETGNPATVAVPTVAGNYTYILVDVKDASSTQCLQSVSNQSATVTVNPLPDATITTESMVTAASSGNIASVADAGTAAAYTWGITNGSITAGLGTRSITYKAGNSGSVNITVSVTGSGSCSPVNGSIVVPTTPLPCPNPAITVSPYVCSASTGNIAAVANAGTGATYVWTITNGTITSGSGTRQVIFTAAANKYLDFKSDDYLSLSVKVTNASGGCTLSSGTYKICISPIPLAIIATPLSVCSLSSGNIASVPFACYGATYKWTITNGTITGGTGTRCITYTAGASGSATLSVTVTNSNGCSASSGNQTVVIGGLPVATITTVSSVCAASGSHTASVPAGSVGTKYAWSISNGSINSGCNANSITYSAGASGSVTLAVIVTNSSGCKASPGNKLVTIIALPNPTITAASSVCASSTANTASVNNAGSGASYAWTISGGAITSGSGTSSIKYTAGATGYVTFNITVTNSNGCKATCIKTVTIITLPAATITASLSVCGGSASNIASVSNGGTGATYAWSISNGTITSGGTTSSIKYTAGSSGTVALRITVSNSTGCKATGSKNVTISAATIPSFAQTGPLCQKSTPPSLSTKSTNGITGTWNPAKISTSAIGSITYTFTPAAGQCASGTTMKITVKSCTALSNDYIASDNQAISKAAPLIDAVILPNPSENFFTLVIKGNRKEVAEVRILDVQGRWLDHFRIPAGSRIQFGGNYAHGTYIVQVLQGTDQKILKAIKAIT